VRFPIFRDGLKLTSVDSGVTSSCSTSKRITIRISPGAQPTTFVVAAREACAQVPRRTAPNSPDAKLHFP
jgi:hypothetical protein